MAYGASTMYTIGTALSRAEQNAIPVEVLVGGHWLSGHIVASDGIGVVLSNAGEEHSVVRMDSISAVRVFTEAPIGKDVVEARPMPRPRPA